MDDGTYEQIPRWKHREEVAHARIQGFMAGILLAVFCWLVLGPILGVLDALADHHPGKLLLGFTVVFIGVVIWMAVTTRRAK